MIVESPIRAKKIELAIIREFLRFMNFRVVKIVPGERPDATVTIREAGGRSMKIGIEHTEYYVDSPPGKASPGKEVHHFWTLVKSSIGRRVSHRPAIQDVTGLVVLKKDALRAWSNEIQNKAKAEQASRLARGLAHELVALATECTPFTTQDHSVITTTFSEEYPHTKRFVRKVTLFPTGTACCVSWECTDSSASSIGISPGKIASLIQGKSRKFPNYDWADAEERWLLISASGTTVFNLAGSRPRDVSWKSPELLSACRSSGVDRIFLWDRTFKWSKEIWPGAALVKGEWRAGMRGCLERR